MIGTKILYNHSLYVLYQKICYTKPTVPTVNKLNLIFVSSFTTKQCLRASFLLKTKTDLDVCLVR